MEKFYPGNWVVNSKANFGTPMWRTVSIVLLLVVNCSDAKSTDIQVAVASNFSSSLKSLVVMFEQQTPFKVNVIAGSSGKLFAQINHGAPFDMFLSADAYRPLLLEQSGKGVAGSRFTYAKGKLVFWHPSYDPQHFTPNILISESVENISIANPIVAPYGVAAKSALQSLALWDAIEEKLVRGENIAQAVQFVQTGNAQIGLVPLSAMLELKQSRYTEIPAQQYEAIEQQAILLNDSLASRRFMRFLQSAQAKQIIGELGYYPQ